MGNQPAALVSRILHLLAGGIGMGCGSQRSGFLQCLQKGKILVHFRGIVPPGDLVIGQDLSIFLSIRLAQGFAILCAGLGRRKIGAFQMNASDRRQLLLCLLYYTNALFQHFKVCGYHSGKQRSRAVAQVGQHRIFGAFQITVSKIRACTAMAVDIHKAGSYIAAFCIDGAIIGTGRIHRKDLAFLQVKIYILKFSVYKNFSVCDPCYHINPPSGGCRCHCHNRELHWDACAG